MISFDAQEAEKESQTLGAAPAGRPSKDGTVVSSRYLGMSPFAARFVAAGTHLLAVALLFGFAFWSLGFLLRDDLFVYGDNAGQFFRLWFPLSVSAPQGNFVDWNPYWYAGYPELQFYPPGFALLGWVIQAGALGHLSPVGVYEALVFIAYLSPALTVYVLLVWLRLGKLAALFGGLALLVFPDMFGGVGAVFDGMLGDRLSLTLVPLALLFGLWAIERERYWLPSALLGLTIAGIILLHPFQAAAPLVAILLAGLLRRKRWRAVVVPTVGGMVALAIDAFWLLPLLAHSGFATPVLRVPFAVLGEWLFGGQLPFFAVLAVLGFGRAFAEESRTRAALLTLAITPLATLAFILFDYLVLVDRLAWYTLDPVRFIETIYLMVIILGAAGFGEILRLIKRNANLAGWKRRASVPAFLGAAVLVYLLYRPFPSYLASNQPREAGEPRFLSEAIDKYRLAKLWEILRAEPDGRVLFTSSQFRLRRTGELFPTYLMALSPTFTGRETIGGTFHHWSPLATFYWYGTSKVPVMKDRTDLMDDQTLFGLRWKAMDGDRLTETLRRLNVTTIVASEYDLWTRTFLDRSPYFTTVYSDPDYYVVYRLKDYQPSLLAFDGGVQANLLERQTKHLRIRVDHAAEGAMLTVKIAAYPLWHAYANGKSVSVETDELGLLRLNLPAGTNYHVDLRYEAGMAEQLGQGFTTLGIVGLVLAGVGGLVFMVVRLRRS